MERSFCPTRLIEIRRDTSGYRLCLKSRSIDSVVTQYVTLSHCWGAIQPLTLTSENLNEFTENIAFHALPQTFRDAVSATYELGYQYLWIDSLCIIQNSEEDWLKESADMMEVYRHCVLNLSAQDSENSTQGLFFQHTMSDIKPLVWQSRCQDTHDRLFFLCPIDFWTDQVSNSNLSSRAWVMQERLLAPRVLHFGKRQLFWECQEFRGCETAPGGLGPEINGGSLAPNLPNQISIYQEKLASTRGSQGDFVAKDWKLVNPFFKLDRYDAAFGSDPFDSFDHIWKEIVTKYTRCSLTKPRDKLIAISGLAKTLQMAYGGEYCAGLWKSAIIGQLAWRVQRRVRRPDIYRAPTWTWASLDVEIRFAIEHTPMETINQASLESVDITPLTTDTTGALKDAILHLKGRLYPAMMSDGGQGYSEMEFETSSCEMRVNNKIHLDVQPTTAINSLYCMPIRASKPSVRERYVPCWWSLLLRPSSRIKQAYERWGLLYTAIELDETPNDLLSAHVLGYRVDALTEASEQFYSFKEERNEKYPEQIVSIV